jgi:SNF2 family DNA or RNA helicase
LASVENITERGLEMPNKTVDIEMHGNRIWARIPYADGAGPRYAKKVIGARWSKQEKVWTYPLDIEVCRRLREVFGTQLRVGTELAAWAADAIASEKRAEGMIGMSLAEPVDLPNVEQYAPTMWRAMQDRGYQTVGAAFPAIMGNCINADQPGLGKTIETFGAIIEAGVAGHILVAAPRTSLNATWKSEIEKWLSDVVGGVFAAVATGTRDERNAAIRAVRESTARYSFLLINPEMVRASKANDCSDEFDCSKRHAHIHPDYPALFEQPWDFFIGDEVHKYLMRANPRSKSPSQVGLGFQKLPVAVDGLRKLALTGTPMKGKPRNLWGTLHWLRPDLYPSQWRWSEMYFKTEESAYAYSGKKVTDELDPAREDAFNRELNRMMIRRTKSELRRINPAWAPPDKMYFEVWVDMQVKQERAYRQMERGSAAQLEGGSLTANGILAEMTRLKQFAGCLGKLENGNFKPTLPSAKFDWLVDSFLQERGITGDPKTEQGEAKVVVASQFTSFIRLWADELRRTGIECFVITGDTSDPERAASAERFQQPGGPRVFLINTNAGGVSITLDAADDVVIMDETWVPDEQEQVEDRAHRTSDTEHQVSIWYVRTKGTIEEDIANTVELKDINQKRVLDGRRGIEYAKRKFGTKVAS